MTHSSATIQTTPESLPSTPCWMGEVAVFAQVLSQTGILKAVQDKVRFARARFGQYDLINFTVVLIGYAVSGEPTLIFPDFRRVATHANLVAHRQPA